LTLFDGVNLTGVDGTDFDTSRGRRTSWIVSLNSLYRDWAHRNSWKVKLLQWVKLLLLYR
jgi:hypothetical protein